MKSQKGFTLIELMIVIAIIGIIGSVAYPSYLNHVRKSARSDAHVGLLRMADLQERFYLQNSRYGTNAEVAAITENGYYTLSVTASSASGYTLTAVANATSSQVSDTGCTSITLNQAGQKLPAVCWN